jgi:hypothetical protein
MLRLAAGDADALSGRYISVEDDIDALLKECSADQSTYQRLLRVNGVDGLACSIAGRV